MEWDGFAESADEVGALSGDHDKVERVAELLAEADEVGVVARFVQGRVFAAWDDTKLNVGPSLLYDALALAGDETPEVIEDRVAEVGDVGEVAAGLDLSGQATFGGTAATVEGVYDGLVRVAEGSGEGSEETKRRTLANLFMDSSPLGAKYLARLVLGEMRLGVGEGTVREAIAEAFRADDELVERGLMLTNDVGEVAEVARDEGDEGLAALEMRIGRPVKPMLAQTGEASNVLDHGEAAVEWKYDGARLQVHVGDETRLFSRSLEDLTDSLPDVVEEAEEDAEKGVILDAEVVAVDADGNPLPFQEVLRRLRRKHRVEEVRDEVALELHVFDVLYDDGAVIDEPLRDRYERLDRVVNETRARSRLVGDADEVHEELREATEAGHEGVMVKNPESAYTPGARGGDWLKLKPEPETLDLVVTGGEWGEGRRASLVGSYLLGARADDGDGYETVGKVATGLTDDELESLTERFEDLIVGQDGKEIEFQPSVVFEVGYEEIQASPEYTSGYALRFPRFVRVRDDKDAEDADPVEKVERLYERGEYDG